MEFEPDSKPAKTLGMPAEHTNSPDWRDCQTSGDPKRQKLTPEQIRITIFNVVATANFGCTFDLTQIAWELNGEYNPKTFAAVQLRIACPKTTALVFGSGKVVCTGASSENAAWIALGIYLRKLSRFHPEVRRARNLYN